MQTRLRREADTRGSAPEQLTPPDAIKLDDVGHSLLAQLKLAARRPLPEGAVGPVLVVLLGVGREYALPVAAAEDQQPVEVLAADAARPHAGRFGEPRAAAGSDGLPIFSSSDAADRVDADDEGDCDERDDPAAGEEGGDECEDEQGDRGDAVGG